MPHALPELAARRDPNAQHWLFFDVETRGAVELRKAGAWRYAADSLTAVLCCCYAVDDEPVQAWAPGDVVPNEFIAAAQNANWQLVAHNAEFERAIMTHVLAPRHGWPIPPVERQICTMAMAHAAALPGSLEDAAKALGLPYQKDAEGAALMRAMARPRKLMKGEDPNKTCWIDSPEQRARLAEYCTRDVEATRELYKRLPPLPPGERLIFELDAAINARGFHCDVPLAEAAREIAQQAQTAIDAEIAELTGGEITSAGQVNRILEFCRRNGHSIERLGKRNVSAVLAHKPGDSAGRLLELRHEGARSSTAKFDTLLAGVDADGRMRGTLKFYGAATGRWSAARFQPQNLPKPEIEDIDRAIAAIMSGNLARVREIGPPLAVVSSVVRSVLSAAPGHMLIGGDFSSIESRVLAWLASEGRKLASYREFDATGDPQHEPYWVTASLILGRTVTPKDEADRAIGKTCDLAFGYGGGLGAYRKFDASDARSDAEVERFKSAWRAAHSATRRLWHAIDDATKRALLGRPSELAGGKLKFAMDGDALTITLPGGRELRYPKARLGPGKFENSTAVYFHDNARGGWVEIEAWFGLFVENIVQAVARDLLAAAMLRLEANGYPIILHVHDEITTEVRAGFGSEKEFLRLMLELPGWGKDLPIAAKVWCGKRYSKNKSAATDAEENSTAEDEPPETTLDEHRQKPMAVEEVTTMPDDDPIAEAVAGAAAMADAGNGAAMVAPSAPTAGPGGGEFEESDERSVPWSTPNLVGVPPGGAEFEAILASLSPEDCAIVRPAAIGNEQGRDAGQQHDGSGASSTQAEDEQPQNGGQYNGYYSDKKPWGGALAIYVYRDQREEPHLKITRTKTKQFPQAFRANGQWLSKKPAGWVNLPYRLPELTAAASAEPTWIPEGEKDVLNLAALGLIATCNPGGAGKWGVELTQWFKGKQTAFLLEDNDAAGRAHVAKVASLLHEIIPDIRIVSFPELPERGDVSDWLDAGHTREELIARAEAAPKWKPPQLRSKLASQYEMEAVEWLWKYRIAKGALNVLSGLPDKGKGLTWCDIVARITTGNTWPAGEGCAPKGNAIVLSPEDNIKNTIVPRLTAAGANLDRIAIVEMMSNPDGSERLFNLVTDLPALKAKIEEIGDVAVIVIDPVAAHLGVGKVAPGSETDVRGVLTPLAKLAEEKQIAILAVMHFNKKVEVTNALLRIANSIAYAAIARSVYAALDDPENEDGFLFVKVKANLAPKDLPALRYTTNARHVGFDTRLNKPIEGAFIVWGEQVRTTALDAMEAIAGGTRGNARKEAEDFLLSRLAGGPVLADEIYAEAKAHCITTATLKRAKKDLRIRSVKAQDCITGSWYWQLPKPEEAGMSGRV
jgi:DNA polymerase